MAQTKTVNNGVNVDALLAARTALIAYAAAPRSCAATWATATACPAAWAASRAPAVVAGAPAVYAPLWPYLAAAGMTPAWPRPPGSGRRPAGNRHRARTEFRRALYERG